MARQNATAAGPITLPAFAAGGAAHFFGTKHVAGFAGRGVRPRTVVSVKQVHGTDTLIVDRPVETGAHFEGGWDALVTDQPGVLLTIRTADCVPVLLHDPIRGVVAAIHAGWRGAVAGIVPRTIAAMRRRFGAELGSLRVGIGPSAGACCYEVDEPVLGRLREGFHGWPSVVRRHRPGRGMLDLRELVRRQATDLGLRPERVAAVNLCTICHDGLFYSYRREGTARGTMVSGIMLTDRPRTKRKAEA